MPSIGLQVKALRSSIATSRTQCLASRFSRSMATVTDLPSSAALKSHQPPAPRFPVAAAATTQLKRYARRPNVITTIYKFPTMEPVKFAEYGADRLHLPLRRDLLHRAVIFEADGTRQGTASTKTRWEIHGSGKKIRPQKGTGRARLGTRQAPHLRGGAKWNGPKPRDFSTKLPRKIYNLAWRTALSYRYRKGELIVCEDGMDLERGSAEYLEAIFKYNNWGREDGRSLLITASERTTLFDAMEKNGMHGKVKVVDDVDVKNILETGRLIIEKAALDKILMDHR